VVEVLPEHINLFLSTCKGAQRAGVFYSLPAEAHFRFLLQDLTTNSPGEIEENFVFYPFSRHQATAVTLTPHYKDHLALQRLEQETTPGIYWTLPAPPAAESTGKEVYAGNFKKYQELMQSGACTKAILSTIIKKQIPAQFNIGRYIFQLRQLYPRAFIYVFSSPLTGTWLGATPETLVKWNDGEVATMSLAGTRKLNDHAFVFGNKEKEEQRIVTNYICQAFEERFGKISFGDPVELNYGEMVHLLTRIAAQTPVGFTANDLLALAETLHPTPAVGGYPKKAGVDLILTTETHSRLYYSGYLGPVAAQAAELAVNLRCMYLEKEHFYVFAGGGITSDSKLEDEWNETRLKADALLKFL
jgi:isochorismate synthase